MEMFLTLSLSLALSKYKYFREQFSLKVRQSSLLQSHISNHQVLFVYNKKVTPSSCRPRAYIL